MFAGYKESGRGILELRIRLACFSWDNIAEGLVGEIGGRG
jgi:hypothetical protein